MRISGLFSLIRIYWRVRTDGCSSLVGRARKFVYLRIFNKHRAGDFVYISSQVSTPVFGLVTNIIAARYILPYELGVIQTVMLVTIYCSFFHLGVFNGLNRNVAFYAAQQNTIKLQDMVDASWLVAIINAFVGVLISVAVLVYFHLHGYPRLYLYSVAAILGILTFLPICTHYETIYRGCCSFMPLGISLNISSFANLVLGLLPMAFGALGLIFRYAITQMITCLLLFKKSPIKHKSVGKLDEIIDLVRVGVPMLITGVLYMFYTAADRTIVAVMLGPSAVGELALSGMIATAIQILPMSLGALFYPRASRIYGISKTSLALKKVLVLSLTLNIIIILPLCLMSYFLIGLVTERFLPNYIGGIETAKIYSLSSMFLIYFGVTMIFPVVKKNVPLMVGCVISLLIVWILGVAFVKLGFGIEGIAWAKFIANAFMCLFVLAYSYYFVKLEIKA